MSRRTQLILHGLSTFDVPHLRGWQPDDPDRFAEVIWIDIGHRSTRGSDQFTLRVATPAGLAGLQAHRGVVATTTVICGAGSRTWSPRVMGPTGASA